MRRPAVGGFALSAVFLLGGCSLVGTRHPAAAAPEQSRSPLPRAGRAQIQPASPPEDVTYPDAGPATWQVAGVHGPVAGRAGTLLRFHVAVEEGIAGVAPDEFARAVTATLSDPRSWTGGGRWRLELTAAGEPADFTIYLVTPATRDKLCRDGYDRYTSCRSGNSVVLNVARWVHGVPHYDARLDEYRQYMVNHEMGHRLGHGHEKCPGQGLPAPVMQQQTLGLHGCVANEWPYLNGVDYHGPIGAYRDPVPPAA
ncbi:MAG TPA: DUF3152 domain-containing protein [Planosporangium sp.]|jgi:hypothetical protein|nr:DUF3152 domain-containing protein [Planosporangium sp.]